MVYQWKFKREQHDNKAINALIERAEKIADGRAPLKKTRFLNVTDITTELDQVTIGRARQLAGLKGYVTNLPTSRMDGAAVIAAYHDLWKVEQLFRMTKDDLRARPVFRQLWAAGDRRFALHLARIWHAPPQQAGPFLI